MLETIKEIPFIDESSAVRVLATDSGKIVLERNDRVIWAREQTALESPNIDCYVEADKFFTLLPEIKSLVQSTCLEVTLKNGARYELPFLEVSWETQEMPENYSDSITFKLSDLVLCTLNNLIRPELQCIYIDQDGAVSCDFVSACISNDVKASKAFLLPPDVQALVDGRLCKVEVTEDKIFIKSSDFEIITSKPAMEEGDEWYNDLRAIISGATSFKTAEALTESLKRLAMFADHIKFDGEKVIAGENYEPFAFEDLAGAQYEIEKVAKVASIAGQITAKDGNLIFKNDKSTFVVSPMEEA